MQHMYQLRVNNLVCIIKPLRPFLVNTACLSSVLRTNRNRVCKTNGEMIVTEKKQTNILHCFALICETYRRVLCCIVTTQYRQQCHYVIGVGRFRTLGGQGLEYWGAKGEPNLQQAHDVIMTSMRRNDVASMSFRRHVPNRSLINQCQIITFLILKYVIIENSRIELRGIVLPVQVGGLLGGGGGQRYVGPPSQIIGGGAGPPWPPLFLRLCMCSCVMCTDK